MRQLVMTALPGLPEIGPEAPLAALLCQAMRRADLVPCDGDVIVVAQKIISKAEGRRVRLADVVPGERAQALASEADKDARLVEVILRESREVLRVKRGVLIAEHRLGFVMANAGVDRSNVPGPGDEDVLLLPENPDASARHLRAALRELTAADMGVVVNDSFGRAWRHGVAGVAIGVAGVPALLDQRGKLDRDGRALKVTQVGAADELAAAASLLMGQADESVPAVLARGFPYPLRESAISEVLRPAHEDLFR